MLRGIEDNWELGKRVCGGGGGGRQTILKEYCSFSACGEHTHRQTMYTERDINTCTSHCGNFGERGEGRWGMKC
jgi:hypothetical protein